MLATYDTADDTIRVLFALATEAEYGPALQSLFRPVITGVGPVEAAASIAKALGAYPADLVINLGSAGSSTLPQAEIFQIAAVSYRDMDASPLGFPKGETPFLGLPAVLEIPQRLPGIPSARLSTGAAIINGPAYDGLDADMVDMETYAVLRACTLHGATMIGLRGISDGREPVSRYSDWTRYLAEIDARLADIVLQLPEAFAEKPRSFWTAAT